MTVTSASGPISVKIPEAVRLSGLSRSRIYELMRSGDIEFAKVGSSTLIIVESLRGPKGILNAVSATAGRYSAASSSRRGGAR
jgi:hypothetical protein